MSIAWIRVYGVASWTRRRALFVRSLFLLDANNASCICLNNSRAKQIL